MKRAAAPEIIPAPRSQQLSFNWSPRLPGSSGSTGDVAGHSPARLTTQRHMAARWRWHERWFTLELR